MSSGIGKRGDLFHPGSTKVGPACTKIRQDSKGRRRGEDMSSQPDKTIEALLLEKRQFPPRKSFREQANVRDPSIYRKADRDFEKFWAGFARELSWYKPWKRVLEWKPPKAKWFLGGKINASVNCIDRHVLGRSEEHTSELQSQFHLVCRLLL